MPLRSAFELRLVASCEVFEMQLKQQAADKAAEDEDEMERDFPL